MNKIFKQLVLVATIMLTAINAPATSPTPQEHLDGRINFVGKLINESSASRKVEQSNSAAARVLQGEARELYELALTFREKGDVDAASEQLSQAIQKMYAAVDAANATDAGTKVKGSRDYENRLASVEALLDAHARIAEEKGQQNEHVRLAVQVHGEIDKADMLLAAGDVGAARTQLDHSYEVVRHAVEELRNGETLVRKLNFVSKKEEYEYEIDRNDTHRMLINMLVKDRKNLVNKKRNDVNARQQAELLLVNAGDLRAEAEQLARYGKYQEAIKKLEESTGQLVKAIRGAGVYIPG